MKLTSIHAISPASLDDLATLYQLVFAGHPWHEDLLCLRCTAEAEKRAAADGGAVEIRLYTTNACSKSHSGPAPTLLLGAAPTCPECNSALSAYYPDYKDHHELLAEALTQPRFVGYLGRVGEELAGFSFGYSVPSVDTKTVAFTMVVPLLERKGLSPSRCFYAAETGIADAFQRAGFGSALTGKRLLDLPGADFDVVIARTANEAVHAYFRRQFGGRDGEKLFDDPVKPGSSWFKWNMADFDERTTRELVARVSKT